MKGIYNLLTNKEAVLKKVDTILIADYLGGRYIKLKTFRISKWIFKFFPYELATSYEIIWNPFKKSIDSELYNYRELGKKSNNLTNLFIRLEEDILERDIISNPTLVKIKKIVEIGSEDYKQIILIINK